MKQLPLPPATLDPLTITGTELLNHIKNRLGALEAERKKEEDRTSELLRRDTPQGTAEASLHLLVALAGDPNNLKGSAIVVKSLVERLAFIAKEIEYMSVLYSRVELQRTYCLSLPEMRRFGI